MNDPTIFPVLIVTLIIAVAAYYQNLKWVSGFVVLGFIIYILVFSTENNVIADQAETGPDLTAHSTISPDAQADIVPEQSEEHDDHEVDEQMVDVETTSVPVKEKRQDRGADSSPMLVNEIVICREVSGRQPIGSGDRFPSSAESIFCFTSIRNLNPEKQKVIHEWRLNGNLMSRVPMDLYFSFNWRCWSQITINSDREGTWTVAVLDTAGNTLEETAFQIVSENQY